MWGGESKVPQMVFARGLLSSTGLSRSAMAVCPRLVGSWDKLERERERERVNKSEAKRRT